MKRVSLFETSDGKTHHDRVTAETHELSIFVRSLIQSEVRADQVKIADFADIIARNADKISERVTKYKRTLSGLRGGKK